MKQDALIKLRVFTLILLPLLFLLASVLTVLYLCGIAANEDVPYLCFATAMALNTVNIVTNQYVKKEDMEKTFPKKLASKGYMIFFIVTAVLWLISYVLFIFLK